MKSLTFFNEKGGMGKTTLNILFASWLRYAQGQEVLMIDFDAPNFPLSNIRKKESLLLQGDNKPFFNLCAGNDFYDIIRGSANPDRGEGCDIRYSLEELGRLERNIRSFKDTHNGYLLYDFPGRYAKGEPFHYIASHGLLDNIVFPIDSDVQSVASAMYVNMDVTDPEFVRRNHLTVAPRCMMLWNRETQAERAGKVDRYADLEERLHSLNIDILPKRIHQIDTLRRDFEDGTPHTKGFLRSTLCYPALNVKTLCPYLEDIFKDIKSRIDGKRNQN